MSAVSDLADWVVAHVDPSFFRLGFSAEQSMPLPLKAAYRRANPPRTKDVDEELDDRRDPLSVEAAEEIRRLRRLLSELGVSP